MQVFVQLTAHLPTDLSHRRSHKSPTGLWEKERGREREREKKRGREKKDLYFLSNPPPKTLETLKKRLQGPPTPKTLACMQGEQYKAMLTRPYKHLVYELPVPFRTLALSGAAVLRSQKTSNEINLSWYVYRWSG